jgi:putative ABC transport system substrate-binding protein
MRERRPLVGALAAVVLALTSASPARPQPSTARLGVLSPSAPKASPNLEAFRQGLRDLGYVEGENIAIESRWGGGRFERLPALAAELVRLKPDVIVAEVTQASLAVKEATRTIPIVMIAVSDPVGAGLVSSLARPGGNVTGTSAMTAEVVGKQLEVLKEMFPGVARIAVVWNPANPVFQTAQLKETKAAAQTVGLSLRIMEARDPDELDRAFAAMSRERPTAVLILGDPLFVIHRHRIADLAVKRKLPTVSGAAALAEAGVLLTHGPSYAEMSRRAATYVHRILQGARPADLPVELPTKFELVINLRTAKTLGLTIPQSLQVRADRLIQ